MQAYPTNDRPESSEERMQRRRARRWKRRARMAGPFLGIPLLLGTLSLSVDLIEYDPQPEGERLADRPIPEAVVEKARERKASSGRSVSTASIVEVPRKSAGDMHLDVTLQDETDLAAKRDFSPPKQPYALQRAR